MGLGLGGRRRAVPRMDGMVAGSRGDRRHARGFARYLLVENRKIAKALAARGLPRVDAPGRFPIAEPVTGCGDETVVGRCIADQAGQIRATGECCEKPDWIEAFCVKDEDHVPCHACGQGVMVVSEHSIH